MENMGANILLTASIILMALVAAIKAIVQTIPMGVVGLSTEMTSKHAQHIIPADGPHIGPPLNSDVGPLMGRLLAD